jgi:thiol-disulfide isomerase/thioredoxin
MRKRGTEYVVLAALAVLAGGCAANDPAASESRGEADGGDAAASAPQDSAETDVQPETDDPPAAVGLRPVDYAGLQKFVESHAGRLVVLDVWSTSCEPCVRELPNLVTLQEDYRDRGVVCATLNIDYTGAVDTTPDDAKAAAQPVLEALGVTAAIGENLYSTMPDRELFKQDLFQQNRLYAPPAIFVFDRTGEVAATFGEAEGEPSVYERVRATVDSLLGSPQPAG